MSTPKLCKEGLTFPEGKAYRRTMKTGDTLTIGEAAARLHVHRNTITAWVERGDLSAHREGRCVLIPVAALDSFTGRTCPNCGKSFTATDARKTYCSAACKWAATYAKRKADHPATRGPGRPPKHTAAPSPNVPTAPDRLAAVLAHVRRNPTA